MQEILIATKNRGKAEEFHALFNKYGISVQTLLDLEETIPDVEETGITFLENAQLKAETISRLLNKPVVADDSGLVVDALDGRPGVYSARYAGEPTNDGRNNQKLLKELHNHTNRSARFTCVLALADPNRETIFATGFCEGKIAEMTKGTNGFGYDPLFIPNGYACTMAELPDDQKNQISHRFHALRELEQKMQQQEILGEQHA